MKILYSTLIIASLLLFTNCSSNKNKGSDKDMIDTEVDMIEVAQQKTVKTIFLNLPSPIELTQTLLASDAEFDKELLNSVKNIDNYNSSASLALNFGVYGADLCYCRVYEQLQESISYLAMIRKITDKLQIPEEEGAQTISRIEESIENRDSIFQIIADTYADADGYLKENERDITAAFILLGGWVEGMHFAINIEKTQENKEAIIKRIAEQKYPLSNIMVLLDGYKDDASLVELYPLFVKLSEAYDKVSIEHGKTVIVTDDDTNATTIDNTTKIDIKPENLDEIALLIGEIRSKIVS